MAAQMYVEIESKDGRKIRGYDFWVCPWRDMTEVIREVTEELEGAWDLRITMLGQFTEQQWQEYCEEREIDWEGWNS